MDTINYLINLFIGVVYRLHTKILSINDAYAIYLTDKELHFYVIGVFGLVLFFCVFVLFKWLEKMHLTIISAWIYAFTVLVVITFSIEIAQGYSGSGYMDFDDIVAGLKGYFLMSLAFIVFVALFALIRKLFRIVKANKENA